MNVEPRGQVTQILRGDQDANKLLPLVYDELRLRARGLMSGERRDHTLQSTGLVHEAFIRLVDQRRVDWQGRNHFLAVAAIAMRRLLVDHARAHVANKRGGDQLRITLSDLPLDSPDVTLESLLDLDKAIAGLRELNPRHARVVELRCFAGMSSKQIASELETSTRTIERDWIVARAWLRRELTTETSS